MRLTNEKKTIIKNRINDLIDSGMNEKQKIIQKIVEEFGIPRPDVRRITRELREEMMNKIKILQSEVMITGRGNKIG